MEGRDLSPGPRYGVRPARTHDRGCEKEDGVTVAGGGVDVVGEDWGGSVLLRAASGSGTSRVRVAGASSRNRRHRDGWYGATSRLVSRPVHPRLGSP